MEIVEFFRYVGGLITDLPDLLSHLSSLADKIFSFIGSVMDSLGLDMRYFQSVLLIGALLSWYLITSKPAKHAVGISLLAATVISIFYGG